MAEDVSLWISAGAFLVSIILGVFGYLRRAPVVSASVAEELRETIAALRAERSDLAARVAYLEGRVKELRDDIEFYQRKYRELLERGANA